MQPGTIDLIIFGMIFIGLQALWILPIRRNKNESYKKTIDLSKERTQLEKLYRK